jgi:hypothetical protein
VEGGKEKKEILLFRQLSIFPKMTLNPVFSSLTFSLLGGLITSINTPLSIFPLPSNTIEVRKAKCLVSQAP